MSDAELTLWAGSVLPYSLDERLRAATAGGFAATSLFPIDVWRAREAGIDDAELRGRFERAGVRVAVIDPLARWLPTWRRPVDLPADDPALGDFDAEDVFAMATALGAEVVSVLALFDPPVDAVEAARTFGALCDDAARRDLRLAAEFIPGTGIPDLALAWEIVRRADRANGGLILDCWHFDRSRSDLALLRSIPPERIFALQLDDAPAQAGDDLATESLHGRLIPGEGELDLGALLSALAVVPPLVGPEVFSDALSRLDAGELGRRLGDATRAVLA
jgi:sugar phosphate isomerase/epimerase